METNNSFSWNTYDIFYENKVKVKDLVVETQNSNQVDNKINNSSFIFNEEYFDNKLNKQREKYSFDLGSCIINANNNILCFNKNTINSQSNSYFKVDQLFLENSNHNTIKVKNIYSSLNGPRYRVTNVRK